MKLKWPFMALTSVLPVSEDTGPSPMYTDAPLPRTTCCTKRCNQGRTCVLLAPCPKPTREAIPKRPFSVFLVNAEGVRANVCICTFSGEVSLACVISHARRNYDRYVILDVNGTLLYSTFLHPSPYN